MADDEKFDVDEAQEHLDEIEKKIQHVRKETEHDPSVGGTREDPAWIQDDSPEGDSTIAPPG